MEACRVHEACAVLAILPMEEGNVVGECAGPRVHLTGGNRSGYRGNRPYGPGPVTVPASYQPGVQKFLNLNSKN
jgi:hypothetical protein